jgi:hypothetical protein
VTFDIGLLDIRYRTPSKPADSKVVKNVDIECAFDIEVFDIECDGRYRTSDTRYRGGKDPWPDAYGFYGPGKPGPGTGMRLQVTVP